MKLQTRTVLVVTVLLVGGIVATTLAAVRTAQDSFLEEAEEEGALIAHLLADGTEYTRDVGQNLAKLHVRKLTAEGYWIAQLVSAAPTKTRAALGSWLAPVATRAGLQQVAAFGAKGQLLAVWPAGSLSTVEAEALGGWAAQVGGEPAVRRAGQTTEVAVKAVEHEVWVVCRAERIGRDGRLDPTGLSELLGDLASSGKVDVAVVDRDYQVIADADDEAERELSARDREVLKSVFDGGGPGSHLAHGVLTGISPIVDEGEIEGAAIVRLPTEHVQRAVQQSIRNALLMALVVLVVAALIIPVVTSRLVTRPVSRLSEAALAVEHGKYDQTGAVADIADRPDEIGHLARTFQLMSQEVESREQKLWQAKLDTIHRLVLAAEHKDPDTAFHIQRMSLYAAALARQVGLPGEEVDLIRLASPMHDVGKLGVPDAVLLKPGRLDEDEWEQMKQHTVRGGSMLDGSASELLQTGREIALSHHEKWDGSGYPYGLSGEAIPLYGRICAVADVFDALTSERPYKPAFPVEQAYQMLRDGSGTHFEARLVDAFIAARDEIEQIRVRYHEGSEQDRR